MLSSPSGTSVKQEEKNFNILKMSSEAEYWVENKIRTTMMLFVFYSFSLVSLFYYSFFFHRPTTAWGISIKRRRRRFTFFDTRCIRRVRFYFLRLSRSPFFFIFWYPQTPSYHFFGEVLRRFWNQRSRFWK